MIGLTEQIAAVRREIEMRKRAYAHYTAMNRHRRNHMTKSKAEREIARMEAVLTTLESLVAKGGK